MPLNIIPNTNISRFETHYIAAAATDREHCDKGVIVSVTRQLYFKFLRTDGSDLTDFNVNTEKYINL